MQYRANRRRGMKSTCTVYDTVARPPKKTCKRLQRREIDTHRVRYCRTAQKRSRRRPQRREIDTQRLRYCRTTQIKNLQTAAEARNRHAYSTILSHGRKKNSQTAAAVRTRHASFAILLNEKNMTMPNLRDCSRFWALPRKSLKSPQSGARPKSKETCGRSEDSQQNIELYVRGVQVF